MFPSINASKYMLFFLSMTVTNVNKPVTWTVIKTIKFHPNKKWMNCILIHIDIIIKFETATAIRFSD